MSAPEPDLARQQRRHRGPLVGMALAVLLAILGFVWWLGHEVDGADPAAPATEAPLPPSQITPQTETLVPRPEAPATAP